MLFNSYVFFLIFLPVFLVLFFVLRSRTGEASVVGCRWLTVIFSLLFYAPFGWRNFLVLVMSILVNALLAKLITGHKSRTLLAFGVIMNVACLLAFKFTGVFFPVAISFYTFNQISFLVDLHRGEISGLELLDYLNYILFFPKLLQGPLMGYSDFEREFDKAVADRADYEVLLRGLYLFSLGLFKKVILADTFGKAVDYGFTNIPGLGSLEAVLVAVFYSFQLYFDFSGYCDMAAAICMMMGFKLPVNFNSPYKAVNIVDFWKRWHITLTKFFTKYIYIPLGGNRKGTARTYINLMIVFLISGLWHGNGWTFIVWGALHGALYVVTRAVGAGKTGTAEHSGSEDQVPFRVVKTLLTFIYVTLAWVFFRAASVKDALALIGRMFTGGRKPIATALSSCFQLDELWYVIKVTPVMKLGFAWDVCLWLFVIAAVVIIFFAKNAIMRAKECTIGVKTTLLTGVLIVWSVVTFAGVSTFLYMNF